MGMGRRGMRFMEDGREWILPGLLYVLVLYGEPEDDTRAMVGRFVEVSKRTGLNVNASKSKGIVLRKD